MEQAFTLSTLLIYEDNDLIVLNKPSGLLSIEDGYQPSLPNLRELLIVRFGEIWTVHRLDKETSGVILFAKNAKMHKRLNFLFASRMVKKTYQVIVQGFPIWDEKTVAYPLRVNGDRKHRTIIDPEHGKPAVTHLTLIRRCSAWSHFAAMPQTGYTHQIRAHCAAIGHPIFGDALYSRSCPTIPHPGNRTMLYLHASSIEFPDCASGQQITFTTPLPPHFDDFIQPENKIQDC